MRFRIFKITTTYACINTFLRVLALSIGIFLLPFSDVSCFSAGRNIAAGTTAGSERPFELNA